MIINLQEALRTAAPAFRHAGKGQLGADELLSEYCFPAAGRQ